MTKQDIINYVMNTPHNSNAAVLSSMLDMFVASDNKEEIELSVTENGIYTPDNGKVYKKVTVNVPIPAIEDGGLSTAHVEFICTGEEGYLYTVDSIPMVVDGVLGVNSLLVNEGHAESADIPISENGFVINTDAFEGIDTSEPIALTGNISIDEDVCIITGDGTITCKGTDGK